MNKRIDDLIIKRNISKNEITDVKKSQISTDETEDIRSATTDETEDIRSATTDETEDIRSATTDETEDIRSATTDETEEERDNSTKINKPLHEISKPYRISIRGKILHG